jgi:FkbM family methyltransferase
MPYDVKQELDELRNQMQSDLPWRSTPPFHIGIATEPTVQVLFRDFVRPGSFVFDVGAHIGSLTQALSRRVGPFGRVISVEANPQTVPFLTANLVKNALFNCFIVNEAVWHTADQYLNVMEGGAASSVAVGADGIGVVKTTTIDELCDRFGQMPGFLKLDIEGAELDALLGAERLLGSRHPDIVFEHNVGDDRALKLLRDLNYWTMGATTYREVASSSDLEPGCDVTNILAIPRTAAALPYQRARVEMLGEHDRFEVITDEHPTRYRVMLELQAGRHVVTLDASADDQSTVYTRVSFNGFVLGELCTNFGFFIRNHRDMVFHAETAGRYVFEVGELPSASAGRLRPARAVIRRVIL